MFQFDRVENPAQGLFGGLPGGPSRLALNASTKVASKGRVTLSQGDRLNLDYAGGGGYGPPEQRDGASLAADLRDGFVSREAAEKIYRSSEAARS
jgi:N-methylhydantoinase B